MNKPMTETPIPSEPAMRAARAMHNLGAFPEAKEPGIVVMAKWIDRETGLPDLILFCKDYRHVPAARAALAKAGAA